MHSPKLATVAGRPSGSNPNTSNKGKKNKQYLRISPLHRLVLVASYKRAKRAAAASSKKQIPTCVSLEELMRLTGGSWKPKLKPQTPANDIPASKIPVPPAESNNTPASDTPASTPTALAIPPDDTASNSTTADAMDVDEAEAGADKTTTQTQQTVRDIGPMPEFPEELARQWGWVDDSYKLMGLHRRTRTGWVRIKEPIDDFGRGIMGLPPLPRDVLEVRLEERRQEDLQVYMKRHGVTRSETCDKCRTNGKKCDGARPKCSECDLWDEDCRYNIRYSSSAADDIRREIVMKLKADIDSAVDKITKLTVTPATPALATSTDNTTNAAAAVEDVTSLPSEPPTQTPSSGSGSASDAAAAVAIRTEIVPTSGTETRPGLSDFGFRRPRLSSARPVLRLRLRRTASKPRLGRSGLFPSEPSSRTQHSAPTAPQPNAPTLNAHATNGAGPMEVCPPDPPLAVPLLMPPSLSGSSSASSSSGSSLIHTPPEGDAPKVGVVAGTGPAALDDPARSTAPAPYTSVVEGRDDEAKEAAYAMLGLGNAPQKSKPKPAARARRPAPQKAQPAPLNQQPAPSAAAAAATPPARGEPSSLRDIPAIIVSPPEREIATVESITALLARLTLEPVPAAKPVRIIDENFLYAAPWAAQTRCGTSQGKAEGGQEDDEVARMLGELVDEMCA